MAAFYFVFATLLLIFFDLVLPQAAIDPTLLRQVQAVKAQAEIGITAVVIYALAYSNQRSLKATNQRLTDANRVLEILFRLFRHNHRNDMNVIRGFTRLLRRSANSPDDRAAFDRILDSANEVINYSQKASRIQQIVGDETEQTVIDVAGETHSIVGDLQEIYPDATITMTEIGETPVRANSLLHKAIEELIENAIVHNNSPTPTVEVSIEPGDEYVTLSVADNGPGIPITERKPLERGHETKLIHTSGLGLWQVYWTMVESDGKIRIDNRPAGGTIVSLSIPSSEESPERSLYRLRKFVLGSGGTREPTREDPSDTTVTTPDGDDEEVTAPNHLQAD